MIATQTPPATTQTVLADRFILTGVGQFTLVFPAVWVAEIVRIDRSQILDLPFYNPLMAGVIHHNGQIVPLIVATRLLKVEKFALSERLVVVTLNAAAGKLASIGLVVDRAIGTTTRPELPPELFTSSPSDAQMCLISADMIPSDLWQPRN